MQNSITIQSTVDTNFINRLIKILILITIAVSISIPIYYAIEEPSDKPIDIPSDTDIDWNKPPCNPYELSKDWKEVTHPKMVNRRDFIYKNTNIKISFEKGIPGETGHKAVDHWHRHNPNKVNRHDQYLDRNGKTTGKGKNNSHIDPNCK